MEAWQREAAARLPELWDDEDVRDSPGQFCFELLPFVRDAHRRHDEAALERAYGFALWCHRQGGELRNAVGVSFHEHLFDSFDVHEDVAKRLDPQVVADCWSLWDARLDERRLRALRALLDRG
jgi:hypothetical protein